MVRENVGREIASELRAWDQLVYGTVCFTLSANDELLLVSGKGNLKELSVDLNLWIEDGN